MFCFYTSNYEDIVKKGVINSYYLFKEEDFFDEVILMCPFARKSATITLDNGVKIIQYGWQSRFPILNRFKLTKLFGTIIVLFKLLFLLPYTIFMFKPDVIRANDPYYLGLIGLFYSKLFNIPFCVSVHSDYQKCFLSDGFTFTILGSRYLPLKIEKYIFNKTMMILPISQYLKNVIIGMHGIDDQKIKVIYHGLDFDKFDGVVYSDIRKKFGINQNKKIISYVARLSKEKNSLDLLLIATNLNKIRNDWIMIIAGDGLERVFMENYIQEHGLAEQVKFLGFQDREIIVNLRKQSFMAICLFDGHSLIEACAAKRPVLGYDTEWHKELILDGKTGFLVQENDINGAVSKINSLLDNIELSDNMGILARNEAYNKLNISKTTKVKQKYYSALIGE